VQCRGATIRNTRGGGPSSGGDGLGSGLNKKKKSGGGHTASRHITGKPNRNYNGTDKNQEYGVSIGEEERCLCYTRCT